MQMPHGWRPLAAAAPRRGLGPAQRLAGNRFDLAIIPSAFGGGLSPWQAAWRKRASASACSDAAGAAAAQRRCKSGSGAGYRVQASPGELQTALELVCAVCPRRPLAHPLGPCRSRIIPLIAAASAAGPPDLHPPLLPLALPPDQQARGAWQRGSRRHRLPPGALSLIAEQQRSSSSGSSGGSDADGSGSSSGGSGPGGDAATAGSGSGSGHPVLASAAYQAALRASLSRTSLSAEQLVEAAAAQATSPGRQLMEGSPDLQSLLAAAMAALAGPALDEMLQGWTAAAPERPPGFDSQAALALPGLAGEARVGPGGLQAGRRDGCTAMQHCSQLSCLRASKVPKDAAPFPSPAQTPPLCRAVAACLARGKARIRTLSCWKRWGPQQPRRCCWASSMGTA